MTSTTSSSDETKTPANGFSELQMKQLHELLQSILDPIHQRLDAIEAAVGLTTAPETTAPNAATMNALMGKFSSLCTNTKCPPEKVDAATEKHNQEKLTTALSSLAHLFRGISFPSGRFIMDPLSCIVTGGEFAIGADHWWSSLSYQYDLGDISVVGDVLPIFGCYLDLYPRTGTTNRLEKYGDNLVTVYVPTSTVQMLKRQVQKSTGHAVENCDEIVDKKQGLTSFLALTAPENDSGVKVAMYNSETDKNKQIVETQREDFPLSRLYKSAARNPDGRILGGVAMLHANASYSCPPNTYDIESRLPHGIVVELKIKLAGFHCLGIATDFVEQITKKSRTNKKKQEEVS
mmetsp:Transcript_8819/g.18317  ORF Transcript_8819/g.18317 Transcript_8819/m.18317 type:complete len:348 (-) Transcript_8819:209-1252(-)|eukprot:CAMPEP_0197268936 /NCGR_PEP_ID=MMETSP1432-20130617/4472_1 /TAXON_ID=44447 /ORGANISM="Pseudo-nitzschia delicatissima, Strain UNC1205" /LENGTH=347 /DNA_ID=CAMNT_0042734029 /DNA_START=124 /DNA_END=1167 /DNA_ORIENTATION=+